MIDILGEDKQFIEIVKTGNEAKPYYDIKYLDTVTNKTHIGYSSYSLEVISEYLRNEFGFGGKDTNVTTTDCISRAEAQVEIMASNKLQSVDDEVFIKVSDAVDVLRNLPSVTPNTQWHKVGEWEIPNDKVLCVSKYNEYVVGYMFESEVCVTGYAVESENELMYDVAVWMPLPKLEE